VLLDFFRSLSSRIDRTALRRGILPLSDNSK
jgi:hypothetical protein